MTRNDFLKLVLTPEGEYVRQRFKWEYFRDNNALEFIYENSPEDIPDLKRKLIYIINPENAYCSTCGKPNPILRSDNKRFSLCHKECRRGRTNLKGRVDVDEAEIRRLYLEEGKSTYEIREMDVAIDRTKGTRIARNAITRIIGKENIRGHRAAQSLYASTDRYDDNPLNIDIEAVLADWATGEYSSIRLAEKYGVSDFWMRRRLFKHGVYKPKEYKSIVEKTLATSIMSLGLEVVSNTRSIIPNMELDIYIPSHSLAIEINGIYWHSKKEPTYHIKKRNSCINKGLTLLQVTDTQVNHQWDIIQSIIRHKLRLTETTYYARKLSIREVPSQEERDFLNQSHIQGYSQSKLAYGLYREDELVYLMSFATPRFNTHYQWEIIRVASKLNTNTVGGFSRLLRHFIRNHSPQSILSYADLTYGDGKVYSTNGFEHLYDSKPSYSYINCRNEVLSRYQCQKQRIKAMFPDTFDPDLTEQENMARRGYYRLYNSGNAVYVLTIPTDNL